MTSSINSVNVANSENFRNILFSIISDCTGTPISETKYLMHNLLISLQTLTEEEFSKNIGKIILTSRLIKETVKNPDSNHWKKHIAKENGPACETWVPDFSDLFADLEKAGYHDVNPFTCEGFDHVDPAGEPCVSKDKIDAIESEAEILAMQKAQWEKETQNIRLTRPPRFKYPGFEVLEELFVANLPDVFWAHGDYVVKVVEDAGVIEEGKPGAGKKVPGIVITERVKELAPEPVKAFMLDLSEGAYPHMEMDKWLAYSIGNDIWYDYYKPLDMLEFARTAKKHYETLIGDFEDAIYGNPEIDKILPDEEEELQRLMKVVLDDYMEGIGKIFFPEIELMDDYKDAFHHSERQLPTFGFPNWTTQIDYLYRWSEHFSQLENALVEAGLAIPFEDPDDYSLGPADAPIELSEEGLMGFYIANVWIFMCMEALHFNAIRFHRNRLDKHLCDLAI